MNTRSAITPAATIVPAVPAVPGDGAHACDVLVIGGGPGDNVMPAAQ